MKRHQCVISALMLCFWFVSQAFPQQPTPDSRPELLTFEELKQLSDLDPLAGPIAKKVQVIRNTPFISNAAARRGAKPIVLQSAQLGTHIRAAQWNLKRGESVDLIKLIFSDPADFRSRRNRKDFAPGSSGYKEGLVQAEILKNSSILVLNEVDMGMTRTDYRDIAAELAQATNMNYAFGVEFFEIDKTQLGMEEPGQSAKEKTQVRKALGPDPSRYKGLHGSVILSRYPILSARVVPLELQCYDWFRKELEETSFLESTRREAIGRIFLEKVVRQVRRGGRTVLIADLHVPELPEKKVTIVNVHLESRCKPGCREDQMKEILSLIQPITNPVVLSGDFNTTGGDATPTSFKLELKRRSEDPNFWGKLAFQYLTPFGLALDAIGSGVNFGRINRDPTMDKIPVIAPHTEGELFDEINDFRFSDGKSFDFRGNSDRTIDGKSKTLANSNQRTKLGFKPTYKIERKAGNIAGQYKLDWFIVKPYITDPNDEKQSYRFAPHFGRTLDKLNRWIKDRLSDHDPVTIDLPLGEPKIGKKNGSDSLKKISQ